MLKPRHSLGLDAIDLKILSALQSNGRISKTQLAQMVDLSSTPCGLRVDNLHEAGIIRGYHADLDLNLLANLTRFFVTVSMQKWTFTKSKRFEAAVRRVPNIIDCEAVLGVVDYVLTVVAESVAHYQQIMRSLQEMTVDEIDYTTYASSAMIKRNVEIPLLKLCSAEPLAD